MKCKNRPYRIRKFRLHFFPGLYVVNHQDHKCKEKWIGGDAEELIAVTTKDAGKKDWRGR